MAAFHILAESYIDIVTLGKSNSNSPNQNALKLPGNPLEVAVSNAIVDSSHRFHEGGRFCTLSGLDGFHFFKNLVVNSVKTGRLSSRPIDLTFSKECESLSKWVEALTFPFLYSIDRQDVTFNSISQVAGAFLS